MEHEVHGVVIDEGVVTKDLLRGLKEIEIWRWIKSIRKNGIAEINQNTENSPGDLKRIAVTQTPVKDYSNACVKK